MREVLTKTYNTEGASRQLILFFFEGCGDHRDLHSFPTRRSSDLGSGGALAIAVGDQVLMLENATYSVITPEGCAAILWKDSAEAERAAAGLRLTAQHLFKEGIVDQIIDEPAEGAHTDHEAAA